MKREDVYIEVTPETIGAYEEVLRRHGESIGDLRAPETHRNLQFSGAYWWVMYGIYDGRYRVEMTPEEFDKWLTELKVNESKDANAEPSEPGHIVSEASVESVADTSEQDGAEPQQLYAKNGDSYIPVTLCRDHIVAETPNGTKVIVEASNIYVGALRQFQP